MSLINVSSSFSNPNIHNVGANDYSLVDFIPFEILRLIAAFFDDRKDVIHFSLANRHVSHLLSDPLLWNLFLQKDFSHIYPTLKFDFKESPTIYRQLARVMGHLKTGAFRYHAVEGRHALSRRMIISNGKLISVPSNQMNTIQISDLKTGKVLCTLNVNQPVTCLTTCDHQLIAGLEDMTIKIWDITTGIEMKSPTNQDYSLNGQKIKCATAWNGKLMFGLDNGIIMILDPKTAEMQTLDGNQFDITCVVVQNDKLFSGASDCTIKVWDLNTGKEVRTLNGHRHKITCMAVWDDHRLISASADRTLKIWDLKTGQVLQTLRGHRTYVGNMIMFENILLSSSPWDIKIWDLKTQKVLQTFEEEQSQIQYISFSNGQLISCLEDRIINSWDFNFPSLSLYSQQLLEENLEILGKMAHAEYTQQPQVVEELAEKLHPDFKERLKQHSFKLKVPFSSSAAVILRVQTEVCVEALLNAVHSQDHRRASQLLNQMLWIDPHNSIIYFLLWLICDRPDSDRWGEHAFHERQGYSATLLQKEEAIAEFKHILKMKWDGDFPLLLADLGIVTKREYSQKLNCRPTDLPARGLRSAADLQALFNSPHFQYLQIIPEETSKDRTQARESALKKQKAVYALLDELLIATQQKSEETKQCAVAKDESGNVYEVPNPWPAFLEKLKKTKADLSAQGLTPDQFLEKFSPTSYAEIVKMTNALIDEFRSLEPGTQILRLHAYLNQWGIHQKWIRLHQDDGIESLADLLKTAHAPHDIFNMGV